MGRAYDKMLPSCGAVEAHRKSAADAEKVANEFGLDFVCFIRMWQLMWRHRKSASIYRDATSHTNVGLCLDTGHCVYGYGDSVKEAEKYKNKLRFVHIKDCNTKVLEEARRNKWTFEEAIEHKVSP